MIKLRSEVIEAAKDYRYLLDRGYGQKVSLDLVTSRYLLTREERALLLRCIHRTSDYLSIRDKLINDLKGYDLVIDGYNTILTVVSALEGRHLYLCDDCIVRDLRSSYVKDFTTKLINTAIAIIRDYLSMLKPSSVTIILDRNVSWSGKHAEIIKSLMPSANVRLARKADIEVIGSTSVVSSSDFVILERVKYVYDLAGNIVLKNFPNNIIRIDELVCKEPCNLKVK